MLAGLKQHAAEALTRLKTNRLAGTTDGQLREQEAVIWGSIAIVSQDMAEGSRQWEQEADTIQGLLLELGTIRIERERRERRK
jgi:hypothetical protein